MEPATQMRWLMAEGVCGLTGYAGTSQCHLAGLLLTAIFLLTDAVGRERVRRDDVRTCLDIFLVNLAKHLRSRQTQHVVVARQRHGPVFKLPLLIVLCRQSQRLNLRAHGTVQNQNPLS